MQYVRRIAGQLCLILFCVAGFVPSPAAAQVCVGDCNSDHRVVVSELVTSVNLALTSSPTTTCLAVDVNGNGIVAVNELVSAVTSLLRGCPATFTPSHTLTPTRTLTSTITPTRTNTPTPTFTPTITGPPGPSNTPTTTPTITPTASPTPTLEPPSLVVQINPDPVAPGQTMVVSLTATNRRDTALAGTTVRAIIPVNNVAAVVRQYIAGGGTCPSNSCVPGATITWNIGALAPGAARSVNFPLTLLSGASAPADGTIVTVNGSVTADNAPTVDDSATATVDSTPPLALSIDADKDIVLPGGALRYSVYFGNQSVTSQNATTLTLDLPPGVTVQAISDGGIETSGVVAWMLGNLPPGINGVREVLIQVEDDLGEGEALLASAVLQSATDQARGSVVTHVESGAALTLSIDASPDPIAAGESMIVSMTVTNRGLVDLTGVQTGFAIPAFTTGAAPSFMNRIVTCNLGASFGCDVGERAFWTIGALPAGEGITLTYPITVASGQAAPPAGSLILFNADVIADGGLNTSSHRTVAVRALRPLDLEIDANPHPVAPDGELRYTLSFGNRGVGLSAGATLTLPLPEGTTFQSASDNGVVADGVVSWALGDLAPGSSGERRLVVTAAGDAADGQPIRAQATLTSGTTTARASTTTQVESDVPLTLNITVNPDPAEAGEGMIAALTVTNRGLITLFAVEAEIRMPTEVDLASPSFANEAVQCRTGATFSCDNLERALWTVGDLTAGQSRTLTLPVVVKSGQAAPPPGTVISFDGYALANDGSAAYAEESVIVRGTRELDLEIEATPEPVGSGEDLHYRLVFGNGGVGLVAAATLEMPVPEGTTFQSASNGGSLVNDSVVWSLGDLAPGASGVVDLIVQVEASVTQGTPILAAATIVGGSAETRASTVTPVEADLPLTITVAPGPDPVAAGEAMAISVLVTNRGPITLFGVSGLVRIPPEVAPVVPAFTNNGAVQCRVGATFSCDAFELAVWTVGDLAPGQGAILTIPATVLTAQSAPAPGTVITWSALATANDGTQVLARRSVPVSANRPLDLELDATQPVAAGEDLTYSLTFGNRSNGILAGATLELPVPIGTTFQSASDGGVLVDGLVTWSLGDLAVGAGGVREVAVTVPANAIEGTPIAARAYLTAGVVEARAESLNRVENDDPLAVSVTIDPAPVMQGQSLLVSFTVSNEGPVALFGVTANLRVPPEVTPFAVTDGGRCASGATFACDNLEPERWTIGTPTEGLGAGESITFNVPPPVPSGPSASPDGTIITFEADASATGGSQAYTRSSVRVQ